MLVLLTLFAWPHAPIGRMVLCVVPLPFSLPVERSFLRWVTPSFYSGYYSWDCLPFICRFRVRFSTGHLENAALTTFDRATLRVADIVQTLPAGLRLKVVSLE